MKKGCLLFLIILMLVPCSLSAEGNRMGIGLGSASGEHKKSKKTTDLTGEILELPLYTYVSDSGILVGFRLMEFSVDGEIKTSTTRTTIAYKQTLMAAALGYEFEITDSIVIAPQIIKSYFGNSRFHYSSYTDSWGFKHEYVTDTDTIDGTADLSGWEIPLYYVGEFFYFGVKLSAYTNKTEIEWPDGTKSDVSITGATSVVLQTKF